MSQLYSDSQPATEPPNRAPASEDFEELRQRLAEAEATLEAIRSGKVDAVVVEGPGGQQVYTLKSADEPYRVLIEQMQEAALTLNDEGAILFCNQFFSRLIERPHGQVIGHFLTDFLATADGLGMSELLRSTFAAPVAARLTLVAASGRLIPVKLALNLLPGEEFRGICAVATDLTEREEKNRAVEAERLTAAVLEATSDAILMCDDSGRIIRANGNARRMFGDGCLNRRIDDICPLDRPFDDITATRPLSLQGMERQHWMQGRRIDLLCGVRRLADPQLSVSGWVITLSDITAQKEMERELQTADQHKDEFLAVLGHELRNPLAGIANGVTLLQRGAGSADEVQWTHRMLGEQVQQLSSLLNDLLDLTRIKQQKIRLDKAPVDLATIVHKSIATATRLINLRQQQLHLSLPPQPALVFGDATRLEQIISNLLVNAAKYTEQGGSIWVELETAATGVKLHVRDNGIGLAPEMLQRIFEPFTQVPVRGTQSGLGIGLSLARRLVDLHGGEIRVTSPGLGQGSEFTVHLPLAAADLPEQRVAASPSVSGLQPGMRVLIVDDNRDAARSMEILLQDAGCIVRAVHDGASARAAALDHRPEVVLLDIGLPDMDGYGVAAMLRAEDCLQPLLLVAVTGFGNDEAQQRARAAQFDHYLVKPVDHARLLDLLNRAVPAGAPPAAGPQ